MDEVARDARLSRQGLYLHFPNKEELFRATVHHIVSVAPRDATAALEDKGKALPEAIIGAFDAWVGRYVGRFTADAADLVEAAEGLVRTILLEQEGIFLSAVAARLRTAGLTGAYRDAGVSTRQIAETLLFAAKGLKVRCADQNEFLRDFTTVVKVVSAPLPEA